MSSDTAMDFHHIPTIQAHVLMRILAASNLSERDQEMVLGWEHLESRALREIDSHIPLISYLRIFDRLADQLGRPQLGLQLSHEIGPDLVGAIGYLFLNLPTLAKALSAYSDSVFSIQGVTELRFAHDEPSVTYTITDERMQPRRQDVEFSLGHVLTLIRRYLGVHYAPQEVHFEHPRRGPLTNYDEAFGCPVYFEQPRNAMLIRHEDLLRTNPTADAGLATILTHYLRLVDHRDQKPMSWADRISGLLAIETVSVEGETSLPKLENIAARLGMSVHALQRRLRSEGTSLRAIARAKRIAMACRQLSETDLSVLEVAQSLGYSETASFSRAFRSVTGISPVNYRNRQWALIATSGLSEQMQLIDG